MDYWRLLAGQIKGVWGKTARTRSSLAQASNEFNDPRCCGRNCRGQCGLGFTLVFIAASVANAASATRQDLFDLDLDSLMAVKVITASRHEQTVSEAPAIMTVFQHDEIQRLGASSLIDVLKQAPGIETSMDPDGHWRLAIRGTRKDGNILMLLDGQSFNDTYNGQALFDLPVAFIDKVEVIRGPGSALYGSNAVAGVINVITAQSEQGTELAIGSHDNRMLSINGSTSEHQKVWFNLGSNHDDGANQSLIRDNLNTKQYGHSDRWHDDIWLGAGWHNDVINTQLFVFDRDRGAYTGSLLEAIANDSDIAERHYRLSFDSLYQFSEHLTSLPKLQLTQVNHDYLLNELPAGYETHGVIFPEGAYTDERYHTQSLRLDLPLLWQISERFDLLAGLAYENHLIKDYALLRNYRAAGFIPESGLGNYDNVRFEQDGERREITAAYVQSQLQWDSIGVTVGIRRDQYSDYGSSSSPRLALVYKYSNALSFKWLYAEAFRAPTIRELYDETQIGVDGYIGNPDLQPEKTRIVESGAEWEFSHLLWRGNIFYDRVSNLIAIFDPDGSGSRGRFENEGALTGYGAETELIWNALDGLQLFGNISRYENRFEWSSDPMFRKEKLYLDSEGNNTLYNMPRLRLNAGFRANWQDWSLLYSYNYGGRSAANNRSVLEGIRAYRENSVTIPGYARYNLSLKWRSSQQFAVELAVNDAGSDKYSDPDESLLIDRFGSKGLIQPGASYVLRVHYNW